MPSKPSSSVSSNTEKGLFKDKTTTDVDFQQGTRDVDTSDFRNAVDDPDFARTRDAQTSAINALTYGSPFQSVPGGMFAPTAEEQQIAGGMVGQAIPTTMQAQSGEAAQLFGAPSKLQRADPSEIDYGPQAHTPGQQQFWDEWMGEQQNYLSQLAGPQPPPPLVAPSPYMGRADLSPEDNAAAAAARIPPGQSYGKFMPEGQSLVTSGGAPGSGMVMNPGLAPLPGEEPDVAEEQRRARGGGNF